MSRCQCFNALIRRGILIVKDRLQLAGHSQLLAHGFQILIKVLAHDSNKVKGRESSIQAVTI